MGEGSGNGGKGFFGGPITIREIILVIAITGSACLYYFSGQSTIVARINEVESKDNQSVQIATNGLADRIGKLETRAAVIEQHQSASDAAIIDIRGVINGFGAKLDRLSEQIAELRPLITGRPPDGPHR